MRRDDIPLFQEVEGKLRSFDEAFTLQGLNTQRKLHCLVRQLIDSIRRIRYVTVIRQKKLDAIYTNALSEHFDPLKASVWHIQHGNINEAFWLVFLLTHFGKNRITKWNLVRSLYSAIERDGAFWNWERTSSDFKLFRKWLDENQKELKKTGNFGNHRKYQSLDANKSAGTGLAIGSYIEWVGPEHDHNILINRKKEEVGNDAKKLFDALYGSMAEVISFGRMAKFDYLTMVGKLGLAEIEPGSAYLQGATGPKAGARLLFGGSVNSRISDQDLVGMLDALERHLGFFFGMQVLEDALCNWQKSPDVYKYFSG